MLKPLPGKEPVPETAFAGIDRSNQQVKDILLDGGGATHTGWDDFRAVHPLSPALLNVLVALSRALQRERTGLKLVQQLLQRNADAAVGRLIPLGDLWDVLVDGTGAAFTDRLKRESEAAVKFYAKARAHLLGKYGSDTHTDFLADDRFVKTLLLGALAPDVPALRRLTGARLAALNHGSVRSRTVPAGDVVVRRMRDLQATFPSEVRSGGEADPVFPLHLSDLDIEPLLDAVAEEDKAGVRRVWLRDRLWEAIGVRDGQFVAEKEIVRRGTRRVAEFVCGKRAGPLRPAGRAVLPGDHGQRAVRRRLPLRRRRPLPQRRLPALSRPCVGGPSPDIGRTPRSPRPFRPVVLRHRIIDDRFVRLRDDVDVASWRTAVADAEAGLTLPEADARAVRGLQFAEALPPRLAEATLAARLTDEKGARAALAEPVRFVKGSAP